MTLQEPKKIRYFQTKNEVDRKNNKKKNKYQKKNVKIYRQQINKIIKEKKRCY